MRQCALVILAGCGHAAAVPAPAAPPAPAGPSLDARPLYLLVVRGGAPTCERWQIAPDTRDGAVLLREDAGGTVTVGLEVSPTTLVVSWASRDDGTYDYATDCVYRGALRALPDGGLGVGDLAWFGTPGACAQAITDRAPVATDLAACPPTAPPIDPSATIAAWDRTLAEGGVLWSIEDGECAAWQVQHMGVRGDQDLGSVRARRRVHGAVDDITWLYDLRFSEEGYLSTATPTHVVSTADDGTVTTEDLQCSIGNPVFAPTRGAIALPTGIVYLDRAACEGELADRDARAAWGPLFPPLPPARMDSC